MNYNNLVTDALFWLFAWLMLRIFIGLCQPPTPAKRKKRGTWTQDEKRGEEVSDSTANTTE